MSKPKPVDRYCGKVHDRVPLTDGSGDLTVMGGSVTGSVFVQICVGGLNIGFGITTEAARRLVLILAEAAEDTPEDPPAPGGGS